MLPPYLVTKMKQNKKDIANMHRSVSILFCAICDFKQLCEHLTEMELVKVRVKKNTMVSIYALT